MRHRACMLPGTAEGGGREGVVAERERRTPIGGRARPGRTTTRTHWGLPADGPFVCIALVGLKRERKTCRVLCVEVLLLLSGEIGWGSETRRRNRNVAHFRKNTHTLNARQGVHAESIALNLYP